jgi:hypothetical protein
MSGIDQLKSKLVALDGTCAQLIAELGQSKFRFYFLLFF